MPRPKEFDIDDTLDRAITVFQEQGFDGASVGGLLDAMQISRQSLYDTYGDKRSLFLKSLRRYEETQAWVPFEVLKAPTANRDTVVKVLRTMLAAFHGGNVSCLMINAATTETQNDPVVAEIVQTYYNSVVSVFATALRRSEAAGSWIGGEPAIEVARQAMIACAGATVMSSGGLSPELATASLRHLCDRISGKGRPA